MTKILGVCVFVFAALAVCTPKDATRGEWLLTSCQLAVKATEDSTPINKIAPLESFQVGYCDGLIHGIVGVSPRVCAGKYVTQQQAIRVVLKYLQDHPEELDQKGTTLAEKALAKAFPCSK